MAFPAVAATNSSFETFVASHDEALPASIASGDLLIVFVMLLCGLCSKHTQRDLADLPSRR